MQKYTAAIRITSLEMMKKMQLRPGQWVIIMGAKGQYMGTTAAGTDVIRWQSEGKKFSFGGKDRTVDAKANSVFRKYAKLYGSK